MKKIFVILSICLLIMAFLSIITGKNKFRKKIINDFKYAESTIETTII